jgi:hypothetical protein
MNFQRKMADFAVEGCPADRLEIMGDVQAIEVRMIGEWAAHSHPSPDIHIHAALS